MNDRNQRMKEDLTTSRSILAAAIECLPFEFFALGPDGRYIMQNSVLREHYGDAIGLQPEDFAPDAKTLDLWIDNNRRAFAGERVEAEVEIPFKGEIRTIYNIITPIHVDGEICGILGVNIDLTERKRAEAELRKAHGELEHRVEERTAELAAANEALRHSNDELRAIYDGMFDGLLIADVHTLRFLRANPAICHMLGYAEDELLAMSVRDIHPESELPGVLNRFQQRVAGRRYAGVRSSILHKDGSVVPVEVVGNLLTYHGRPCVAGFFRDITEKRQAEQDLAKQHRTLEHLLHSSDHERQIIAYEIHDGLAQDLAGAIMQFQAFQGLSDAKPQEAAWAFETGMGMLRQGHQESRRLIAGVRPPILDESGVVEAVAHLVNELQKGGPEIEFLHVVSFGRLMPVVENAIYRICQEGLANACCHSRSKRVRISFMQRGERVRVEVRDWGVGFDTERQWPNRFGLEGIRQRAQLLGGRCRVRSVIGRGTRVVVELPVVEREMRE